MDETGSGIFQNQTGAWIDNIGPWYETEGYLIKVDSNQILELESDQLILDESALQIDLSQGWNIISFPIAYESDEIVDVFNNLILPENEELYTVFSETGDIFVPGYITGGDPLNSIGVMSKGEGYYVKVLSNTMLTIKPDTTNTQFSFNTQPIVDNISRDTHFIPVWTGNPLNPMTITVDEFLWNDIPLQSGDEIGVFDGEYCVGVGVVTEDGYINDENNQIKVSKDDGSGNGYTEFNEISFSHRVTRTIRR